MANQVDIELVDKQAKKEVVVDFSISSDSIIGKKEHEKPEKHQGLKEEPKRMRKIKVSGVSVVMVQS